MVEVGAIKLSVIHHSVIQPIGHGLLVIGLWAIGLSSIGLHGRIVVGVHARTGLGRRSAGAADPADVAGQSAGFSERPAEQEFDLRIRAAQFV